jgi:hypothetical protein
MTASMVGIEAALKFTEFAKTFDTQVTIAEVLGDWNSAKKKMGNFAKSNTKYMELSKKLSDWFKFNILSKEQAVELAKFMHDCPVEPRIVTWQGLQSNTKNPTNLFRVHPLVDELMVKTANGEDTSITTSTTKKK